MGLTLKDLDPYLTSWHGVRPFVYRRHDPLTDKDLPYDPCLAHPGFGFKAWQRRWLHGAQDVAVEALIEPHQAVVWQACPALGPEYFGYNFPKFGRETYSLHDAQYLADCMLLKAAKEQLWGVNTFVGVLRRFLGTLE